MRNPVLVLGVGNTLFTDDGAGVYAVRMARSNWKGEGIEFKEVADGGFDLLQHILNYEAVLVVDAAVTGLAEPGEVYTIAPQSLPPSFSTRTHGAGLGTALAVGRSLNLNLPRRMELLAIEARDISTVGYIPTTPVADAIRPASEEILKLAQEMLREVTTLA